MQFIYVQQWGYRGVVMCKVMGRVALCGWGGGSNAVKITQLSDHKIGEITICRNFRGALSVDMRPYGCFLLFVFTRN